MTICEYCRTQLLDDKTWQRSDFKPHHATVETWTKSIDDECGICVALATHFKKALVRLSGERDPYAYENEELKAALHLTTSLPLYRVRYHPRSIRGQIYIGFEPNHFESGITLKDKKEKLDVALLARQSFLAYPASDSSSQLMLDADTRSDRTLSQIKSWLDTCDENHVSCQHKTRAQSTIDQMPKRLIDCGLPGKTDLKLVETREIDYTGPYMTLSHCWGPPEHKPFEHRTPNSAALKISIPWEQLPNTFQHAIEIVRRLGMRYIWIDSICIHQGADGDFLPEGLRMDDIYGRSYCNIAAVHASDSRKGLFSLRNPAALEPFKASAQWEGYTKKYELVRSDYWASKLLSTVLYSRGWVFQERMLSPRILHFTKQEVMWQCATNAASESFPSGLPSSLNFTTAEESRLRSVVTKIGSNKDIDLKTRAALNSIWKMAAENYSRLNLTFETDKIDALSGLARIIGTASTERYHAGLWDYDFVEQLAWRIRGCRNGAGSWSSRYKNDRAYVAPSWSWLSMNGLVDLRERAEQDRTYQLEILPDGEEKTTRKLGYPNAEFARLTSAHFRARVMLYKMSFQLLADDEEEQIWTADCNDHLRLYPDERLHINGQLVKECDLMAIMIAYSDAIDAEVDSKSGLMLAVHPAIKKDTFVRLGLIEFRDVGAEAWKALDGCRVQADLQDVILL